MADKVFTKGLVVIQPKEGSPDWIKARLSFKVSEFVKFLEENMKEDGWCNVDVCESKAGDKWYGQLNNWKPNKDERPEIAKKPIDEISPDDIPF